MARYVRQKSTRCFLNGSVRNKKACSTRLLHPNIECVAPNIEEANLWVVEYALSTTPPAKSLQVTTPVKHI